MIDLLVIGSGYGGSVIAARLAPHAKVLVLERGKAWKPGEFPRTLRDLARARHTTKNPLGLWGMRLGRGTGNAYVSGVGGASLVNYGITARPDDHVLATWPIASAELDAAYRRAAEVLRPSHSPSADSLGDKAFLDRLEPGRRVDLENTIDWRRCTDCGFCVPGCNTGAKRSLDQTYLAMAMAAGAQVVSQREVIDLAPLHDGYRLTVRTTGTRDVETIDARRVVLAGGTFGTLDLLQRARRWLLPSRWFGQRMSMNGDALAFLYNTAYSLSGHHGAPITTSVRLPFIDDSGHERTLTVMSGRIPKIAMRASALLLTLLSFLIGRSSGPRDERSSRAWRRFIDLVRTDPDGALAHTFMYKLDAEDSARGAAVFDADGRSALEWPDYQSDPIMRFAAERLELWAAQVGGVLIPDISTLPGMRSFGVHALGGCRIGRDVDDGVVDPAGRLFRPDGGVYPGLRLADASIIPSALGVPSSWTVAALAEHIAADLTAEIAATR